MKTKIILLIGAAALVTLSFTFANVDTSKNPKPVETVATSHLIAPVGGILSDEVVK